MEKTMNSNIGHYFKHLTCTLFVVLGLLGLLAPASYAAKPVTTVSPVSNLVAKAVSPSQVGLTWAYTDASKISGFSIERSLSPTSSFQTIATAASLDTSLADSPLTGGKSYYYRMRAFSTTGKTTTYSSYSPIATATTPAAVVADTTAPTVAITSPTNATTYTSAQTVIITVTAADNIGVSKVELYDGATLKGTDTTAPYSFAWTITEANNGSHSLTAKAYDAAGNSKISAVAAVTINIPVAAPVTAPGAFTFSAATYSVGEGDGNVNITINRVDGSTGDATVSWRTNAITSTFDQDFTSFSWTILSFADGETQKILPVKIINDTLTEVDETFKVTLAYPTNDSTLGAITSAVVTIQDNDTIAVDTTAPTVSLTSPANDTTYTSAQTVTVTTSASDNIGVSKVELYDGATLKATDTTSPYSFAWAITEANNGSHSLTAKAYDAAGNSKVSAAVAVTVNIPVAAPVTAPGAFTFSAATYSVGEGDGNVNITINRVDGSTGAATVSWRTNAITATFDQDFTSFSWTILSFADGETQKILPIKIINDTLTEVDETFKVTLAYPTNDSTLGAITSAVVTIQDNDTIAVDTTAPTVSLTSPTAGTTFTTAQTVRIAASATSSTGVSKVDLYDGATLLKNDTTSPYYFDWAITSANNGNHNLTAKVYDAAGNSKVSTVAVTVNIPVQDLSAATVSLTSPAAGATFTSAQTVRIAAATSTTGVSKVDLYDGATLLKNDTTSPYYFDWPITSADNGSHSLTAKVYDAAGNSTVSAAVVINVKIETTIVSTETVFYGYDKNAGANDDPYAAPYGGITRYVDPGKGVNSGNGSITSPWKDLQYALTHATAGDSIYLRGGVHNYGITISGNVAATQLKPVEVRSYPGEWAIIDGSNIANGNLVRLFNESWIIFRNFEIRYSDKTKVSNGIYAENLTDCEFHNIYMHNNNGAGFSAKELYRVKFFNCSAINNIDIQTSGDSADGFSVTSGDSNAFYRCVATGNSDDGYDFWAASKHYLEDCISATNGSGTGGDGNGFKLGKPDPAPYAGLRGGYHTLVRCISLKNKFRGYSENATTNGSTLTGCIAYNSGQNWELPNAAHKVTNGISFDGNGDKIGSATTVTASEGQGFGGTVYVSDFESVNIADMNNQTAGQRFFYAVRNLF